MLAAFVARPRGWTQSNASAGGGAPFVLEVGAGANAKGAAEAFESAKGQQAAAGPSAG